MHDDLAGSIARHAAQLFDSREMYCAQAILTAVDEGLGGGLGRERARRLATGFGEGLGTAGCVCGALSGAVLAASWFLSSVLGAQEVRRISRELHESFKEAHGSSCCRVLTKPVRHDSCLHREKCSELTRRGAELAARAILRRMPELAGAAAPVRARARLAGLLRRLADRL